jgi:DNA-binding XRE family transcriptional regulator
MERTKANFRAAREIVGLSQSDLAGLVGVSTQAVKRWEHPDGPQPPTDAWELLEAWLRLHREAIDAMADVVDGARMDGHGRVALPYYRSQAEYDAFGRDPGPFGVVNARARALWAILDEPGVLDVEFIAPDEMGAETLTR